MPNHNKPKISPKTMKAAAQIYRDYSIADTLTYPGLDGEATVVHIKNIIERHTNLTAKEKLLEDLGEVYEKLVRIPQMMWTRERQAEETYQIVLNSLYILAKAKAALEDK